MTLRARLGAAFAAAVFLILPATALGASTIKVNPAHDGACSDGECGTIADALAAAEPGDTIDVMAGTYSESPDVDKAVELKGAGSDTRIIGSNTGDVLTISATGAKVSSLSVQAPADAQSAIVIAASGAIVSSVIATRTGGTEPVVDVTTGLATLEKTYIVQGSGAGTGAIRSSAAAGLKLVEAIVLSNKGPALVLENSLANVIQRSTLATLDPKSNGVEVQSRIDSASKKKLVVDSSVIVGGSDMTGLYAHTAPGTLPTPGAPLPVPSEAGSVDVLVRHATILGGKGIIAHAEANHAVTDEDHGDVKVQVFSSIVHGESRTASYPGAPLIYAANEATVSFTTSDAPPSPNYPAVTRDESTSFTARDRLFRAGTFSLRADSPLIDKGGVVDAGEADTDLEGDPRAVDGNQDGLVATDIGADEFVNKAPTAKFAATGSPKAGELVGFISNAIDPEANAGGGIVEYRWDFGDGTKETTAVFAVGHTYANKGTYKVTLTTVDKQGATATSDPVTVVVRDGTPPRITIALPESDATYTLNPKPRKGSRRKPAPLQLGAVGTAADDEAVKTVEVALTLTKRDPVPKPKKKKKKKKRASKSASTCEQFTGMGFTKRSCDELQWIKVSVFGTGWTFITPKGLRIPAGRYQMRVRGTDAEGNATPSPKVSDKTLVGFRVK